MDLVNALLAAVGELLSTLVALLDGVLPGGAPPLSLPPLPPVLPPLPPVIPPIP